MANSISDDEVVLLEHKRSQRMRHLQYAAMLLFVCFLGLQYMPMSEDLRDALFFPYGVYAMGACVIAMAIYRVVFIGLPSAPAKNVRLIPRLVDDYQSSARRQWMILLLILLMAVASGNHLIADVERGMRAHHLPADYDITHFGILGPALMALCLVGTALSFAIPLLWFRRTDNQALKDELAAELRAKALKVGYIGAMASLAGAFVVLSVAAVSPLRLILWLGYANVALPVIWYLALEWRAGHSG
jgi:hypothetical protein